MFDPLRIASIVQGRWLVEPTDHVRPAGVSIDTRTLQDGDVFFAVKGERFDGHDYVDKAFEAGASFAVVSREVDIAGPEDAGAPRPVLLVPDTLVALQRLATSWRDELKTHKVQVVAITGSSGKTTTRQLIHSVLSSRFAGTQSPKSFNNHLGVPLTLLAAKTADDFVVAEVGTNHPGEIRDLAAILQPDVAVITNIGTAHIGQFGTREAIGREKASLAQFVQPAGCVIVPCDEDWPDVVIPMPADTTLVKVGEHVGSDFHIENVEADPAGVCFTINQLLTVNTPLVGRHNAYNAAMAVAVGRWVGVRDEDICHALQHAEPPPMRLQVQTIAPPRDRGVRQPLVLLNDAYNANPNSMLAALETLQSYEPASDGRRVAVIGDMLELGADADAEHRHLGTAITQMSNGPRPIHRVICVGELMQRCAETLRLAWTGDRVRHVEQLDEPTIDAVAGALNPGDVVLLKASRKLALERLIPAIERHIR